MILIRVLVGKEKAETVDPDVWLLNKDLGSIYGNI